MAGRLVGVDGGEIDPVVLRVAEAGDHVAIGTPTVLSAMALKSNRSGPPPPVRVSRPRPPVRVFAAALPMRMLASVFPIALTFAYADQRQVFDIGSEGEAD